jgi:hypothetical protein
LKIKIENNSGYYIYEIQANQLFGLMIVTAIKKIKVLKTGLVGFRCLTGNRSGGKFLSHARDNFTTAT